MPTASLHPSMTIAAHVRACEADGQVVLLDLIRNRYLAVGAASARALSTKVQGWPVQPADGADNAHHGDATASVDKLVRDLIAQGLLDDASPGPRIHPVIGEATDCLDYGDEWGSSPLGTGMVARFLISAAKASWWLRHRNLQVIVATLAEKRARAEPANAPQLGSMKQATARFERLRPLVFTSRDKCLYDSLALMAFLATEKHFPRWVIGVKTSPFGAHSWVQAGSTVLNDQHEYVRRFRPILVV